MKISSKLRALGEKSKSELIEDRISVSTIRGFKILQEEMSESEGRDEAAPKHRIKSKASNRKKRLKIIESEDESVSEESNDGAEVDSIDTEGDHLDYGSDSSNGEE